MIRDAEASGNRDGGGGSAAAGPPVQGLQGLLTGSRKETIT